MKQQSLPGSLERHELKYTIPHDLVEPISDFIAPYCEPDAHTLGADEGFYQVNSLYFDTRSSQFLKLRLYGSDNRFNMRARAYADGEAGTIYLEVKHRRATISRKHRVEIAGGDWPGVLTNPERYPAPQGSNLALFQRLAMSYAIEPKVFTQYQRRAFFSLIDPYTRITMDRAMKVRPQTALTCDNPYSLRPDGGLINYDNETIYADQEITRDNVILELKCTVGFVPIWIIALIRTFQLKQIGFSKYLNSALVSGEDNGDQYMNGAITGTHAQEIT